MKIKGERRIAISRGERYLWRFGLMVCVIGALNIAGMRSEQAAGDEDCETACIQSTCFAQYINKAKQCKRSWKILEEDMIETADVVWILKGLGGGAKTQTNPQFRWRNVTNCMVACPVDNGWSFATNCANPEGNYGQPQQRYYCKGGS